MYRMVGLAWVCGGLLTASGCTSDQGFTAQAPQLAVAPNLLQFAPAVAGEEALTLELFVTNAGTGVRDLEAQLQVGGDDPEAFSVEPATVAVAAGESETVRVTFAPDEVRDHDARILVTSNDADPERGIDAVGLTGTGRLPRLPDIDVDVVLVDFGDVSPGPHVEEDLFFNVRNVGEAPLVIDEQQQTGSAAFVVNSLAGDTIGDGRSESVVVRYRPRTDKGDSGLLRFLSNDPDEPAVEVELRGNGGSDEQCYPVAKIDCPSGVEFRRPFALDLDGSDSEPVDDPLSYRWEIVQRPPAANPDTLPVPADEAVTSVYVDAAGTWVFSLVVTADSPFGPLDSIPARCEVEALPVDEMFVELNWSGPTADFDLHVAENEADFFTVPGDCSWCNPNPDWGVRGEPADDPTLGGDSASGGGPEFVSVPEPADGVYVVRVHAFDDGEDGRTTASVQVFLRGELAWEGQRVLSRNEVWDVGQVNWPDENFGPYSVPSWDAGGLRECR